MPRLQTCVVFGHVGLSWSLVFLKMVRWTGLRWTGVGSVGLSYAGPLPLWGRPACKKDRHTSPEPKTVYPNIHRFLPFPLESEDGIVQLRLREGFSQLSAGVFFRRSGSGSRPRSS